MLLFSRINVGSNNVYKVGFFRDGEAECNSKLVSTAVCICPYMYIRLTCIRVMRSEFLMPAAKLINYNITSSCICNSYYSKCVCIFLSFINVYRDGNENEVELCLQSVPMTAFGTTLVL